MKPGGLKIAQENPYEPPLEDVTSVKNVQQVLLELRAAIDSLIDDLASNKNERIEEELKILLVNYLSNFKKLYLLNRLTPTDDLLIKKIEENFPELQGQVKQIIS